MNYGFYLHYHIKHKVLNTNVNKPKKKENESFNNLIISKAYKMTIHKNIYLHSENKGLKISLHPPAWVA